MGVVGGICSLDGASNRAFARCRSLELEAQSFPGWDSLRWRALVGGHDEGSREEQEGKQSRHERKGGPQATGRIG
jgi:hypothetical protein